MASGIHIRECQSFTNMATGLWINHCYRYIFLEFTVSLVCFTFIHWFVFYLFIFSNYRRNICSRDWRRHAIVTHCSRKIDGDNIDKQVQMNLYATPRQNGLWINHCYRYIFSEFIVSYMYL